MENTLKACLFEILEDLLEAELTKFKFKLTHISLASEYNHIPRGTLEQATRETLADLLIQYYGEEYSKTVTQQVLKAINQRSLAEKLSRLMENAGSSTSTGKVSGKVCKRKREDESGVEKEKWKQKFQALNIFPGKKKTSYGAGPDPRDVNPSNEKTATQNQHFYDLLRRLKLESFYHKKITKSRALLISKTSLDGTQPTTEGELPFFFLHKLLTLDYHLRHLVYRGNIDTKSTVAQTLKTTEPRKEFLRFEDIFIIKETLPTTVQTCIHPMDIQMAIFHCADDFTRQYMFTKLSICQFALPLLVPDPCHLQIEFPLWPLRQVRKSWREVEEVGWEKKIKNFNNQVISCQPIHIVSFIRFGQFLSTSKSRLLNSLLSKNKHDNFFHCHCRKEKSSCLLMRGVVEICWFCPGGGTEDSFKNCIAFTNLHGNAEEHERQVKFLRDVSSVAVILLSTSDFNESSKSILHEFWASSKPLICLFENVEHFLDEKLPHVRIGIKNLSEVELADKIAATITQLLKGSESPCSLSKCVDIAKKYEFIIDEEQKHCQKAVREANKLMELWGDKKVSEIKKESLLLQGEWHSWCKKDKELYQLREKGNKSIEQYKEETEKEKQAIRCEQYNKYIQFDEPVKYLLKRLQSQPDTHTELYFLQELSMLIDQRTSKELEKLHQKRNSLLAQVGAEKQNHSMRDSVRRWKVELKAVSKEICDSTLGIEHLLREVGQIYEALEETSPQTNPESLFLPQIAADLMIRGVPIELMDGDASYVPLKWVAAVFDKLSEKLGDKHVFVVSVLGLQNSGKSTLLNVVFGLQFSLNSGRCTRGAYMQLLRVEETLREQLGFDFVLVVDTEGLRGSQVINKSQNEENELATFVIGLGNVTLINVLEKDLPEIQNILQIAVHAFLRMKQLKVSPRCLFVHQNTGETAVTNQNRERRKRMQERLDEIAVAAAKHEECPEVSQFSDVIKFDPKTHIHYFAHLWEGYSPMAPPNPCYSHNAQELKTRILRNAKEESGRSILKISELKVRIQELWKALVSENFIFSFRNTQELTAMRKLETMYSSWAWELRSHMLHLQNQVTNQIQHGEVEEFQKNSTENQVLEKHKAIKQELEKCFREDKDRDIFAQWKGKFENDLDNLKDELTVETKTKIENLISAKKTQELLKENMVKFEHILREKIQDLTVSANRRELHDMALRQIFNKIWSEHISTVLSPTLPCAEDPDIDIDLENILLEKFKQQSNIVNKIRYRDKKKKFSINYSKHVITPQKFQVYGPVDDFEKDIIDETTAQIITKVREIIHKREQQNESYSSSYFHEILQVIHGKAEAASQEGKFTLTDRYKLELALQLFQEAADSFKKMHVAFKRANDPDLYLESKREEFFLHFKLSYKRCQNAD